MNFQLEEVLLYFSLPLLLISITTYHYKPSKVHLTLIALGAFGTALAKVTGGLFITTILIAFCYNLTIADESVRRAPTIIVSLVTALIAGIVLHVTFFDVNPDDQFSIPRAMISIREYLYCSGAALATLMLISPLIKNRHQPYSNYLLAALLASYGYLFALFLGSKSSIYHAVVPEFIFLFSIALSLSMLKKQNFSIRKIFISYVIGLIFYGFGTTKFLFASALFLTIGSLIFFLYSKQKNTIARDLVIISAGITAVSVLQYVSQIHITLILLLYISLIIGICTKGSYHTHTIFYIFGWLSCLVFITKGIILAATVGASGIKFHSLIDKNDQAVVIDFSSTQIPKNGETCHIGYLIGKQAKAYGNPIIKFDLIECKAHNYAFHYDLKDYTNFDRSNTPKANLTNLTAGEKFFGSANNFIKQYPLTVYSIE